MTDIQILLIEDNKDDAQLTREVFKELKVANNITVCKDGEEALKYLKTNKPDLIILDLNLPKISGLQVLDVVKKDDRLKEVPVIMLTTSDREEDIRNSYLKGANSFIVKPIGLADFLKCAFSIEEFWFKLVRLPSRK